MSTTEFASRQPAPALRPFVRRYVGYRQDGITLAHHRGLPSRSITFVLSFADPIRMLAGPGGPVTTQCAVGGLHLSPAILAQDRFQHGMHLELNPLGVHALLGVSATELAGTVRDVADLPTRWGGNLVDRLRDCPNWTPRHSHRWRW